MKKTITRVAEKIALKTALKVVATKRPPNQHGKWVFKPLRSTVVSCACGSKYIVTRKNQTECVSCMYAKSRMLR